MRPRTATGWTALVLGVLVFASNAWWVYVTYDMAITASYREDQLRSNQEALSNALALVPALNATAQKAELVAEAERLFEVESFEKDGCVWVGKLGLKFDDNNRLVHMTKSWTFGEENPCFPK